MIPAVALVMVMAAPPPAAPRAESYLSPGGVLRAGAHAFFIKGDTELPGLPAVFAGWRMGIGGFMDLGLEAGGLHVAGVGRLHLKFRLWESKGRRGFLGLRLRIEFKRHEQSFGDTFRPLDDFGLVFAPELSFAWRLGQRRAHAIYYAFFYYLDVDVRKTLPTGQRRLDHYFMLLMIGYEYRFHFGLHLQLDAGVGVEAFRRETEGFPIPRFRVLIGYSFGG